MYAGLIHRVGSICQKCGIALLLGSKRVGKPSWEP
jgi:hypothetical protein